MRNTSLAAIKALYAFVQWTSCAFTVEPVSKESSSSAHKRHNLHLVPRLQRLIVFLRPHQPLIHLDGHSLRLEPGIGQQRENICSLGHLAFFAIDLDLH